MKRLLLVMLSVVSATKPFDDKKVVLGFIGGAVIGVGLMNWALGGRNASTVSSQPDENLASSSSESKSSNAESLESESSQEGAIPPAPSIVPVFGQTASKKSPNTNLLGEIRAGKSLKHAEQIVYVDAHEKLLNQIKAGRPLKPVIPRDVTLEDVYGQSQSASSAKGEAYWNNFETNLKNKKQQELAEQQEKKDKRFAANAFGSIGGNDSVTE